MEHSLAREARSEPSAVSVTQIVRARSPVDYECLGDADGDSYSPVPWDDVFDTSLDLDGDTMTFEVEFDQDQLSDAGNYDSDSNDVGAGTSSPMPDDEDENDEAFGGVRPDKYLYLVMVN